MGDVARQAGVSKATVSAVLNGGSARSSTRERVLAAIELLNYRPAAVPGRAQPRPGRSLGLVVKEIDNPYYGEVLNGVRSAAEARGYTVLAVSSEGDYDIERRAVEVLRAKDVDGLLVTPVMHAAADLSHLFELKRRNFPFVLLEEVLGVPASLVDIDNVEASRRATEYLIGIGHTRIAHFAGPEYSMHSRQRIDGTRWACSASRLVFTDDAVVPAGAHLADGYAAARAFFTARAADERPTAITCYNDLTAIGVCRALAELGLRVPDDVSVIGFDDIPLLDYLPVPLTSVRVPKLRMGQLATEMLMQHIESHTVLPPQRVLLESELVVRASTMPRRGASRSNGGSHDVAAAPQLALSSPLVPHV
jgi:LacI family transcriptional regulator